MTRLLPGLLALLSLTAQAELYQWTDENGKVHFADKAPAGSQARTIPKPEPVRTGGTTTTPTDDPMQAARQLDRDQEKRERDAENLDNKRRRCNDARDDLQYWLDRRPFTINQQNGRKEYYSEPRHSRNLKNAQERAQRHCKGL